MPTGGAGGFNREGSGNSRITSAMPHRDSALTRGRSLPTPA
jgi:hypothetical protein